MLARTTKRYASQVLLRNARSLSSKPFGPLDELERTFLSSKVFVDQLAEKNIDFFTGVPDSVLGDFCAYIQDNIPEHKHVMTANEGHSLAVASGYHFATGKIPLVYLQNSGFGNLMNPLLSLAHRDVYKVPLLLLIGYRGEPGRKDEPQHRVQGRMMPALLSDCEVPFEILPDYDEGAEESLETVMDHFKRKNSPFCLMVRKRTFEKYKPQYDMSNDYPMKREEVIRQIVSSAGNRWASFVGTTGFTSRELYEIRASNLQDHSRDFYTVGCMGHASSIGLGIAVAKPSRDVFVLDGDGASLMQMGGYATIGKTQPKNLKHILINNGCHESTGSQPSGGFGVKWGELASACGYKSILHATNEEELTAALAQLSQMEGPTFLEVKVQPGARKDLGRPKSSPVDNKKQFMQFLSQ